MRQAAKRLASTGLSEGEGSASCHNHSLSYSDSTSRVGEPPEDVAAVEAAFKSLDASRCDETENHARGRLRSWSIP